MIRVTLRSITATSVAGGRRRQRRSIKSPPNDPNLILVLRDMVFDTRCSGRSIRDLVRISVREALSPEIDEPMRTHAADCMRLWLSVGERTTVFTGLSLFRVGFCGTDSGIF